MRQKMLMLGLAVSEWQWLNNMLMGLLKLNLIGFVFVFVFVFVCWSGLVRWSDLM